MLRDIRWPFSAVQLQCFVYVSRSLKIMTALLTRNSYIETFQFSAGQRTVRVSVITSLFPAADCSTLTDGPATEKFRGPKPAVLVRGTTRSP